MLIITCNAKKCVFLAAAVTVIFLVSVAGRYDRRYPKDVWCKGPEWYGPKCSYKCHCEKDNCDDKGKCLTQCSHGWFGPYCQYKTSDVTVEVDGKVQLGHGPLHKCVNDKPQKKVVVRLLKPHVSLWLRIKTDNIDLMKEAEVKFTTKYEERFNYSFKVIEKQFMDVHCYAKYPLRMITITGEQALQHFCSVHVSQGANYALYSLITQPDATDERMPKHPYLVNQGGTLADILGRKESSTILWTFPVSVDVVMIRLYNREDYKNVDGKCCDDRLRGFTLEFRNPAGELLSYKHIDKTQEPLMVYEIILPTRQPSFKSMTIRSRDPDVLLPLREVEVFGETAIECYERDYYGYKCKYKCHCSTDECDTNGGCVSGQCSEGWFGPSCQHKISYAFTRIDGKKQDISTNHICYTNPRETITINPAPPHPFSWLRIWTHDPEAMSQLKINFYIGDIEVCRHPFFLPVDDNYVDVHCFSDFAVFYIKISATQDVLKKVCKIYVSQGSNYALSSQASQSSTYQSWKAEHAVDGKVPQPDNLPEQRRMCSHTSPNDKDPRLVLKLPFAMDVLAFSVYNRVNYQRPYADFVHRLRGFKIYFENGTNVVKYYQDRFKGFYHIYNVTMARRVNAINKVVVKPREPNIVLTICELEVFGDRHCSPGFTGKACNEPCNCDLGFTCVVTIGSCPTNWTRSNDGRSSTSRNLIQNIKQSSAQSNEDNHSVSLVVFFALGVILMM